MSCVLSLKTIRRISNELRERGESVVLTHGAFDLFHSGHASLLKESKKLGNYLIVGVESDERVQAYKSTSRPIIPLEHRIRILLENKSVDFVYAIDDPQFESSFYSKMYQQLSPKIVSFGKQFAAKNKVKKEKKLLQNIEFCEILPFNIQYSNTSQIIEKIRMSQ